MGGRATYFGPPTRQDHRAEELRFLRHRFLWPATKERPPEAEAWLRGAVPARAREGTTRRRKARLKPSVVFVGKSSGIVLIDGVIEEQVARVERHVLREVIEGEPDLHV